MDYSELETQIFQLASSSDDSRRIHFAKDTIRLLRAECEDAIAEELSESEKRLLIGVHFGIENDSIKGLEEKLNALSQSMCHDEVRAIEIHPILTNLLDAIESFLVYKQTGLSVYIGNIAINMVNCVDYSIGGNIDGYSVENILGHPRMQQEYERQQNLLGVD